MDDDRDYLRVVLNRLEELATMPAVLRAVGLSAIRVDLKDFLSDVPTGSPEGIAKQSLSAENLDVLFPFDFSWVLREEALVLTFLDPDRSLLALNRLMIMRNPPVKAVAVDTKEERTKLEPDEFDWDSRNENQHSLDTEP